MGKIIRNGIEYCGYTDVIDNLASYSTTSALSAKQGKVLNEKINDTNDELSNEITTRNKMGAKNILPFPYIFGTRNIDGTIFTMNNDGSITISGTSPSVDTFYGFEGPIQNWRLAQNETYIASMENASNNIVMFIGGYNGQTYNKNIVYVYGEEVSFGNLTYDTYDRLDAGLYVVAGTDLSTPITVKPMIRLSSDTDNTYVPYAKTNKELTLATSGLSNPNVVDNGWFTINQRNFTTTSTDADFTVDRWRFYFDQSGTCTYNADGTITIKKTAGGYSLLFQNSDKFNKLIGKYVTTSLILQDGQILSNSTIVTSILNCMLLYDSRINVRIDFASGLRIINYSSSSLTIKAIKLELGTVSTLVNDVAPDYATELLKCQRYLYVFPSNSAYLPSIRAVSWSASNLACSMSLPVQMRTNSPTLTFTGNIDLIGEGQRQTISSVVASEISSIYAYGSQLTFAFNFSGRTTPPNIPANNVYGIYLHNNEVVVSAE